jgi:hypothetical protein
MEYKYYKNGNIHIRYDSDIDGYNDEHTFAAMICIICNSMLDVEEYECFDYYSYALAIINHAANDETYDYYVTDLIVDDFFDGKWVILRAESKHAYIKIPNFYDSSNVLILNAKKYRVYKLCDKPEQEFVDEMRAHGVIWRYVSPQYAPEQMSFAMCVPFGARIEYL